MADKTLGQIAFEAHRDFLDGNRPWSEVREPEREVWEATAKAVADAVPKRLPGRAWSHDWAYVERDGDGNLILRHAPTGGLYRVLPVEGC